MRAQTLAYTTIIATAWKLLQHITPLQQRIDHQHTNMYFTRLRTGDISHATGRAQLSTTG